MTLLAYSPAIRGEFLWDDEPSIVNNPELQAPGGLGTIWTTIGIIPNESHWWPVTYSVLWIEHQLFGWQSLCFHLVNILLHAAIAIQIWRLMRRPEFTGSCAAGFFGAALFALHPIHVEAVAWIIELKDLLAAAFGLLTIEAFLKYEAQPSRAGQVWVMFAMTAAMLSKSSAIAIPAGLALWIWWKRGRLARSDGEALAPAALVALALGFIDWRVNGLIDTSAVAPPPLLARLATAGRAFWFDASKLAWPLHLSVVYPHFKIDPGSITAWAPLLLMGATTIALWAARSVIGRGPLACWLFYAIAVGPTLGLLHFSFLDVSPAADRYQYIASIAPLAGAGALLAGLLRRFNGTPRRFLAAGLGAGCVLLGIQTALCAGLFRSQTTLFANAAKAAPDSYFAFNNLAVGLLREGRLEETRTALETALRLDPAKIERSGNLAFVLTRLGDDSGAELHYRHGLALSPGDFDLKDGLAWVLATSADPKVFKPAEALALAGEVNRKLPLPNGKYLDTLGAAQAASGDFEGAIASARLALELAKVSGLKELVREISARIDLYRSHRTFERPGSKVSAIRRP